MNNQMNDQTRSNRRSAATQAAVDRFAADPAAKRVRSLTLARQRGLIDAAKAIVIERDDAGVAQIVVSVVPSLSQPGAQHVVLYNASDDTAQCDCPAGANGLACGHAGSGLLAGRAAARYILVALSYRERLIVGHSGDVMSM